MRELSLKARYLISYFVISAFGTKEALSSNQKLSKLKTFDEVIEGLWMKGCALCLFCVISKLHAVL